MGESRRGRVVAGNRAGYLRAAEGASVAEVYDFAAATQGGALSLRLYRRLCTIVSFQNDINVTYCRHYSDS